MTSRDRVRSTRILIVQTAYLGDAVLTIPLVRELRRARPAAEIWTLAAGAGAAAFAGLADVDRRLVLDKRWNGPGRRSYGRLLREVIRTSFDAAVAAHRSIRTGVIVALSGARVRVGFAGAPGAWAYSHAVPWDPQRHAVHRYLALSSPLGGDPAAADPRPALPVDARSARRVASLLAEHGIGRADELLLLAPGSMWPTKRWRPEGFAGVASAAAGRGLRPVLVGAPDEAALCRRVATLASGQVAVLAGETSIQDLVALLARSRLAVCNDSGAAHVAAAVGTPVVSVFGPTSPAAGYTAFGPNSHVVEHPDLGCRPCGRHGSRACPAGHFRCMTEIPATRIVERVDAVLRATAPRQLPRPSDGNTARPRRPSLQPAARVAPG